MRKYQRILAEVLLASFVIQLFGLATPMIFQTVIDKVLVHRGLSTLEVMVAGLALIALFEAVLSGLRTYLFSHTSNRIDVELGARVFRHLMRLPLAYFEARRVGDSVARVRELETIRQFITSSSITLVLDLAFCAVFVGVMFIYSPTLAFMVCSGTAALCAAFSCDHAGLPPPAR
jgi:ATP-binding cassette, subfamily B, bacterial HlyB/CyaB